MDIARLEKSVQYTFMNRALIETALTHPSYGSDHRVPDYQRLEFLGDAVLELCVSRFLYRAHPDMPEGQLTRLRAGIVREETLSEAARALSLADQIRLSPGEERGGGREKPSILSDVFEAVLAAVYLDGGDEEADQLVRRALGERLSGGQVPLDAIDAKTLLQERVQAEGLMPEYQMPEPEGPPHAPVYTARVLVGGEVRGTGKGPSKRRAQQAAALEALNQMDKGAPPPS